jgi:cytochrome c-type biogenesis protein CcmF
MLADLGFFLLFMCTILSGYSTAASVASGRLRHRRLYRSARMAASVSALFCLFASLILWFLLFQKDYSVAYIFKNSSNDLPPIYRITAFWSSLEGSHTLWTLLLSFYSVIALWTAAKDNEHIMPWVNAALQGVLTWMFYMAITYSDPFVRLFPPMSNGQGMNALLQNPYMAIHPPTLFTGYTALAIPYAYAVAALCYGDVTDGWLRTARRWTLYAWIALTCGVWLGGRWAYVELGWAGYWAWDPVENSSFIPWLMATALLHSLIIQEKLGHLKRLSIVLAVTGFFMCFFGTFLTRSGIVSSVHSFAESPIGPNYLTFLAVLMVAFVILYAWRAHAVLPADTDKVWGVSRESALVMTQFLLLTFAAIVVIGTLFPIVSEALTGQRTSIQAPYFNAFAPWIGLGMVVTLGLGNVMRYQSAKIPGGSRMWLSTALAAVPMTVFLIWGGDVLTTPKPFALGAQVVGLYLCAWGMALITWDVGLRLRDLQWNFDLMWDKNRAYVGAWIAHLGILVAIIGFLGNYRGLSSEVTLAKGQSHEFYGYTLTFDGMITGQEGNASLLVAPLTVKRGGEVVGEVRPAKSQYPTKPELLNEVGVRSSFWHDLYVVIADFDRKNGDTVSLQLHINPMVRFVWLAAVILATGGLIALSDRYRGQRSRDVVAGAWEVGS